MKTHRCPYEGFYCNNASCKRCYTSQHGNGCRGIVNAMAVLAIIVLFIILLTSCGQRKRIVAAPDYTVDIITRDSVQYIIVNGNGTAIIKHEPGAIKE